MCCVDQEPLKTQQRKGIFREGSLPRKVYVARMQRRSASTRSIGTKSLAQYHTPNLFEVPQELSGGLWIVAFGGRRTRGSGNLRLESQQKHEIVEMGFVCVGLFRRQGTFVSG